MHHHNEPDDLVRAVEVAEGIVQQQRLRELTSRLKPVASDNAHCPEADHNFALISGALLHPNISLKGEIISLFHSKNSLLFF